MWPDEQFDTVQCLQPFQGVEGFLVLGKNDGVCNVMHVRGVLHVLEHELGALPHHHALTQLVLDLAWFEDLNRSGGQIRVSVDYQSWCVCLR